MPGPRRHILCSQAEGRDHISVAFIALGQAHCGPDCVYEEEVGLTALLVMSLALPLPGFMTYIVEPLFREWARFTGHSALSESMLSHLAHNKAQWKSLLPRQHRSSSGSSGGGGPDHTGPGTEDEEQTVTGGDAP